ARRVIEKASATSPFGGGDAGAGGAGGPVAGGSRGVAPDQSVRGSATCRTGVGAGSAGSPLYRPVMSVTAAYWKLARDGRSRCAASTGSCRWKRRTPCDVVRLPVHHW